MTSVILESSFVELLLNFCVVSSVILGAMWLLDRGYRSVFPDVIETAWKVSIVSVFIAIVPWSFRPSSVVELDEPWIQEQAVNFQLMAEDMYSEWFSSDSHEQLHPINSQQVSERNIFDSQPIGESVNLTRTAPEQVSTRVETLHAQDDIAQLMGRQAPKEYSMNAPNIAVSDGVKIIWATVCLLFFIKVFIEYRIAIRQFGVRKALPKSHKAYRFLKELHFKKAIQSLPRLTVSSEIMSPVSLIGNEICLPKWTLSECSDQQLRSLLAHEAGHLRRNDPFVFLLLHALEKIFFFQPLLRIAHARLRVLAEIAADEWAVRHTNDAREIARALYTCAHKIKTKQQPQWGLAMANNQSILKQRVERLLVAKKPAGIISASLFKLTFLSILMAGVLLVPQLQFAEAKGGGASSSYMIDDEGVSTVRYTDDDFKINAQWAGQITFSDDETMITDVSPRGYFELATDDGDIEREISFRNRNGQLQLAYEVDGEEANFDESGEVWLASNIRFLVQRTGMFAEKRVARMLESGGVAAVVAELDEIESDHVRRVYVTETLNQKDVTSDELVSLLPAIKAMDSDFETRSVLITILDTQDVDASLLPHFLDIAQSIESDFELRTVLVRLTELAPANEASQQAFLALAESIESDFELRQALTAAMDHQFFGNAGVSRALEIAGNSIDSDFELRTVIAYAATELGNNPQATKAAIAALPSIDSDFEMRQGISAIVDNGSLDNDDWLNIIAVTEKISSDFEAAVSLAQIAGPMPRTDEIVAAYEKAMTHISSNFERSRAQSALSGEAMSEEAMVAPAAALDSSTRAVIARRAEAVRVRSEATRVRAAQIMEVEQRALEQEREVLERDRVRLESDREQMEREAAEMRERVAELERELERMKLEDEDGDN